MHDLAIVAAFFAMVIAPCVIAFRSHIEQDEEEESPEAPAAPLQ